eukprot:13035046-Ditylum_brightwellii.AAC.1
MKHFVRTSAGESTKYYQHSEIYMQDGQCTGLYITSIDKKYVTEQVTEEYVDNCDAGTMDQQT